MFAVLVRHEIAHAARFIGDGAHVFDPEDGEEERSGTVHYGDVWHAPVSVVGLKGFDDAEEEGMLGDGTHGIVADSRGDRTAQPGGIAEEGIKTSVTAVVEVNVDPPIMC